MGKSTEFNVGLDWSVLDDRLGGSIDVYNKKTTDLLFWYSVPTPPNLYNTTLAMVVLYVTMVWKLLSTPYRFGQRTLNGKR